MPWTKTRVGGRVVIVVVSLVSRKGRFRPPEGPRPADGSGSPAEQIGASVPQAVARPAGGSAPSGRRSFGGRGAFLARAVPSVRRSAVAVRGELASR